MPFDMSYPAPAMTRRERDAARRKLSKDRAETIVGHLCALTRVALEEGRVLTPLAYEGLFRRVIRSELCLQGWSWSAADDTARDVVAVVFAIMQVKRPNWYEGQPEWTIERGSLIERTRCANCGHPLPEDRPKFCSDGCRKVHGLR
ncbi:hypothetical protein ABIE58_004082, partial [Roseovarius sp. MBR-78]